jgi:GT2 family glycosyltransferase
MTTSSLVSVVILNYKRREAFVRSLDSARAQSYENREIIVVDNNSQDGIREFLASYAPEVRLIELDENLGACGGRNVGIRAAKGDFIITLDNDVFFEGPFEITKAVDTFERRPDIHVLAFQLCDELTGEIRVREWCHPRSMATYGDAEFETNHFIEGACGARRKVYETVGVYFEPLFFGCEGWDLGLRIIDSGFRILHAPQIRLRHLMSMETRTPERPFYYYTRNYVWMAYKDYPVGAGLSFVVWKLLMMLYLSTRSRHLPAYVRGIRDGYRGLRQIRPQRKPIQAVTVRYLRELESWRPSLWTRLRKHRDAVQI